MRLCREREDEEVEWKPTCVVHLTRPEGGDVGGVRSCFNLKDTLKTTFFVGSSDGELVYADWIKPEVGSQQTTQHGPLKIAHSITTPAAGLKTGSSLC